VQQAAQHKAAALLPNSSRIRVACDLVGTHKGRSNEVEADMAAAGHVTKRMENTTD